MKKLFVFIVPIAIGILFAASMFLPRQAIAQAPQKMSYQAVIRDAGNNLVTNHAVGMRVSILQGSTIGAVVYQEIYNPDPQTNANGLVSIEIGSGIPIIGTFAGINWSAGPYFIKTETDPTGSTTYTITGTSQLLSVPYALHAQAADSANYDKLINKPSLFDGQYSSLTGAPTLATVATTGSYTDLSNKPTIPAAQVNSDWNSSSGISQIVNKPTLASVATSGSYNDLTNKPTIDGSETKVTAGTNVIVTGAGTVASPYVINDSAHKIGDSYGGGIVFYVYDNGRHGLIAAATDQSTNMRWYAGTYTHTMALADGVGAGKTNTAIIIANHGYGDGATYAARVCNEYSDTVGGVIYSDWYLPSKYELKLMYSNIGQGALSPNTNIGGFDNDGYWSSTEDNNSLAWGLYFDIGGLYDNNKSFAYYVRAIRAF